jgi:hypothetical protein
MNRYLTIFLAVWTMGCKRVNSPETKLFTLLTPGETGIEFENRLEESETFNIIEYLYYNNGGGVAAGDINNDGWVDLYFTGSETPNKLFLNRGGLLFDDITRLAGAGGRGDWKTGVTMADVNADGFLDIYICHLSDYKGIKGGNELLINNGDLTFSDSTESYGLQFNGFSTQSAFFDYDLDGDLDMFLLNHSVHSRRTYGQVELREEFDPKAGDRLYRNNLMEGNHSFTEVTEESGIYSSQIGYGLNVSIGDLNSDGYPDIYISNDFHENDYLYINNRDGTFTDRFVEMMACSSRSSMGNDIGDMNNDGRLDVVVLDMLPAAENIRQRAGGEDPYDVYQIKRNYGYYYQFVRNTLQLNLGGGLFSEIGRLSGIYATDWSWSPLWCDLDDDGWKDLFITNGIYRRPNDLDYIQFLTSHSKGSQGSEILSDRQLYEKMPLDKLVNYVFRNNGNLTFTNRAEAWGFDKPSFSNGSAYADLDNDGDLDLVINNINEPAFIYRNNSRELLKKNFLNFIFKGDSGNTKGIGVRVTLYDQDRVQLAENYLTRGFYSSVAPELHFGLDSINTVDSIRIEWPGRGNRIIHGVTSNQILEVGVSSMYPGEIPSKKYPEKLFKKVETPWSVEVKHTENRFTDYKYEKLMPHLLSTEGPCIAVGDVNGDQLEDIYFGGSGEQPGILMYQDDHGGFIPLKEELFSGDLFYEDVDAEFFDSDGDGDLDLYIVSGGNEYILPNPFMKDRLYINQGNGKLIRSNDLIPAIYHNGSSVAPCDYDQDGDVDLFVGSRSIPRAYGLSPISNLLINDGRGRFSDQTAGLAPELREAGMVTDAVWMDIDQDRDQDLIITGEWMPLTVMINNQGRLKKQSGSSLDSLKGWWFSLEATDIDQDGDEDLLAGNLGLNSYLKPSRKYPVRLYINDFDGNGQIDQILTYYQDGKEYPFAPADELFKQIPALKSKFTSYDEFAGKTMKELFPERLLNNSIIEEATCFESSIFINLGQGTFKRIPFPVEIQFSTVRDFLIEDFDRDGDPEILIGGNYYPVIPYLGRSDASYGWMLDMQGEADYTVVPPVKSGFQVQGEIRDLEMVHAGNLRMVVAGVNDREPGIFYVQDENFQNLK